MTTIYQPHYSSTDDPDLDHETTLEEDKGPAPLEAIRAVCRRYKVRARLEREGKLVGEISRDGNFTPV